jgi:SAM-dependent methyltransferase
MDDFSKAYFQGVWGEGYYEHFSYGVGIDKVFEVCVSPFLKGTVLEIGSGGGVFTEMIQGKADLIAIDVIKMPERFSEFENFTYYELSDKSFICEPIESESIDFCFSYNVFCHFSNEAIREYLKSVHRVLKPGGDFVFMLAKFERTKKHVDYPERYTLGDLLPMGHFYQDLRTLDLVVGDGWEIVNRDMIPEHRDILIHLKKKYV